MEQKSLAQNSAELLEISEKILDLKTEIVCLEIQKERLIKEHNELIKKEKTANE